VQENIKNEIAAILKSKTSNSILDLKLNYKGLDKFRSPIPDTKYSKKDFRGI
jgi:hypothetical protein